MAKLNKKVQERTHEGAPARSISPELQLRRSVLACLLWEDQFYEDGVEIAKRIADLIPKVEPGKVALLAIEAREQMKLRHMPLLIVREMARSAPHKKFVSDTLPRVIQRADELAEFLAIYWKEGKQPLSGQVKKGLAKAFTSFDAYQLAKYDREGAVKLRDVMFLVHPSPSSEEQGEIWKKLAEGTLAPPDTWEVSLSAGKDKKETWERLMKEKKLGALALLRNLRNMKQASVDEKLVIESIKSMHTERILPFRFISAARHAPQWEPYLEEAMMKCLKGAEKMGGKTVLLVDISGSMDAGLSGKSDMTRMDAACGLAVLARELCEDVEIFSFTDKTIQIPARHGFALRDAIISSQPHGSTMLGAAIDHCNKSCRFDRLVVITDEQAHDKVHDPATRGYMINVASYKNGVGYGAWLHIDGWSEAVLKYIGEIEKFNKAV
ncbi:MAG: TROVE domain-containing protein [Candidatus Eremiobacteraeota bacterium]|nr:TROVE domain-containing protein [Candidatus Eremiobacteraeota bacterium]